MVEKMTSSPRPPAGNEAFPTSPSPTPGIRTRFSSHDLESGRRALRLSRSNSNLQPPTSRTRRHTISPGTVLPITYRTVSFAIEEAKEEVIEALKTNKDPIAELGDIEWHLLSATRVAQRLSTSLTEGLTKAQVEWRKKEHGKNAPSKPPSDLFSRIMGYLFGGFGSVLLIGAILVTITYKPLGNPNPKVSSLALAIVLYAVFVIQALFNAWQDWSSAQTMASISGMLPDECSVLRDALRVDLPAEDLVPGDIIYIKSGNKLPADVRFIEVSSDAKFDRSILTGESQPISGTVVCTDKNYLETQNIGMQGTHCISGSALGITVSTGDKTVFGKIARLTNTPKSGMSLLQKEILRFIVIICSLMLFFNLIVIIAWSAWLRKAHPNWISVGQLIVDIVTVAVAFIPEGLPIALTASLTITAGIMKKNQVLCKSLKTVETLGAVSVICSDKTGTLTKNQMFATECSIGAWKMTTEQASDAILKETVKHNSLSQLRACAGLCNAGEFDFSTLSLPLDERKINGDATDQAILRFSEKLGSVNELKTMWKKTFELAFNSKNKFMIRTLALTDPQGLQEALSKSEALSWNADDLLLTIKGAPDIIVERCTTYVGSDGEVHILDNAMKLVIEEIKDQWSSQGKRVILLARKILPGHQTRHQPSHNTFEGEIMKQATKDLTLIGLVGIVDPPRDEIPEVMRILRRAGIRIFMVTGDFKLTAQAIAIECGIITNLPHLVHDISMLEKEPESEPESESEDDEKNEKEGKEGNEIEASVNDKDSFYSNDDEGSTRSITLSGPELNTLSDYQWDQLCRYSEIVFARTTPEQKLRIVKEFQARSEIVAMTGDGVNDAPSLKAADIGISLASGSHIAIEASDMVLLDSFSAIIEAVKYGRVVFDNLKKTIIYLLPAGTFSEFWPIITSVLLGLPQILSSFLMIMICCLTDCAAATVLAYEKPEMDVLLRKPRNVKRERLVDWKLLVHAYVFLGVQETVASFAMAYWYLHRNQIYLSNLLFHYGVYPSPTPNTPPLLTYPPHVLYHLRVASSIYFLTLILMQWFNLLATRTRRLSLFQQPPLFNPQTQNIWLFPAMGFSLLVVGVFLYIPSVAKIVEAERVPVEYWFFPLCFGGMMLLCDEGRKAWARRWPEGWVAWMAW